MVRSSATRIPPDNGVLFAFLAIVVVGPLLQDDRLFPGMPDWVGGTVSLVALLAALSCLWRQGALRGALLALFVAALALAALSGQWLAWQA